MKPLFSLATLSAALFAATLGLSQAGSLGGPGPFRNSSPLPTGTDGRYQATATGINLTGVMAFEMQNNTQTNNPATNRWVFFVAGRVVQGTTAVTISQNKINGVLDASASSNAPKDSRGGIPIPTAWQISGNGANGFFNGSIAMNTFVFKGTGTINGSPAQTDTIVLLSQPLVDANIVFDGVTIKPVTIPPSVVTTTNFRFKGTMMTPVATGNVSQATASAR